MLDEKTLLLNITKQLKELNDFKVFTSTAPTHAPKNFGEQIVFYKNGSTYRVYLYIDRWLKIYEEII